MIVTTGPRARTLLADPRLQIHHGDGMTCVFDRTTAACQLRSTPGDAGATPDTDDCRPRCPNLARTDRDIETVRHEVDELEERIADPLDPPIRHQREQHELERLRAALHPHVEHGS